MYDPNILLIALVRYTLTKKQSSDLPKECLSKGEALAVIELSKAHGVFAMVATAMKQLNILPESLSTSVNMTILLAVQKTERFQALQHNIILVLAKHKIDFILLKGAVLRPYYPESWMRSSGDLDILVREQEVEYAAKVLVNELSFKRGERNYHDISLLSKGGCLVELHFNIMENMPKIDGVLSTVWDHARKKEKDGYCFVLSDEFQLFHLLCHTLYHFLHGGCGIRPLLDIWLWQQQKTLDYDNFLALCDQCGITKFFKAINALLDVWIEQQQPDKMLLQLQNYIFRGGIAGTKENEVLVRAVNKSNSEYMKERLFWSLDVLQKKYPRLKKHPWLLPFYQLRRFLNIFSAKKRKHLFNSFKAEKEVRKNLKEEQYSQTKKMLTQLDLI